MTGALLEDDATARARAIDVSESFIVQAPAGSGKTELLIQRVLALLAGVGHPEELVAITFTRKAAAEMKNRVLDALRRAREAPEPSPEHEARTWRLARSVLARDAALGWRLESESQQLRIDTVDALNGWLARRLPLAAGAVAGLELVDDARGLYRSAARRTVAALADSGPLATALETLLEALDARLPRLEHLLAELAPRRDQWLRHISPGADALALRGVLEGALQRLIDDHLVVAARLFPADLLGCARELLQRSGRVDTAAATRQEHWEALADLLLTGSGRWRRQVTARQGFPPSDPQGKARCKALLEKLQTREALRQALIDVRRLPAPRYSELHWRHLEALRLVLPHLIAELTLVFQEAETCDFVAVAMAAQRALGATDAPSDLLLAMDRRIQHILVDEFQDTSHTQLHLLETLTAGWEPLDGRTLFLVGDPMQSIYRFRDADMSLFLRVKEQGVGDVRLKSLTLTRNFRSDPRVVDWVNRCFARCMPEADDMGRGAAAYVPAQPARPSSESAHVAVHLLPAGEAGSEAERVVELVRAELAAYDTGSVAVLVQGRNHLAGLQTRLAAAGILAQAVEIQAPNQHQVTQDLIGLTRALLHPEDRIAWLAVLRMPFCGVTLVDLAALCEADHATPIWGLLRSADALARLSADGRQRIASLVAGLEVAFAERGAHGLATWLERTWLRLGADVLLDSAEHTLARRFFARVAAVTRNGDLDDPLDLEASFVEPEPLPIAHSTARVQIMTVHRAKGLEFDAVVFMGLGREWPSDDARALRWLERTTEAGGEDLLLAPLKDNVQGGALHDFIRREERGRDDLERVRLAYVAATRARDRLYLVAQLPAAGSQPAERSLLARLSAVFAAARPEPVRAPAPAAPLQPELRRTRASRKPAPGPIPADPAPQPVPAFEWVSQTAVHVGTVAHRWLQRMAAEGAAAWSPARVASLAAVIRAELRLAGVEPEALGAAGERVRAALTGSLADETGRWILDAAHRDARAELGLTLVGASGPERLIVDRSFIAADGVRWIIDYKTSVHEGSGLEGFLDNEVERYRAQLERYAQAFALLESRPIRVGLYFPLLGAFRDWEPALGSSEGA